jgi:hypothetical protein
MRRRRSKSLERQPAFERKKININLSKKSSDNPVSRYTLSDEGKRGQGSGRITDTCMIM